MANILIVDDSIAMRKMITFALETEAHQVTGASDGKIGLAEVSKSQYDLIITDINMPVMNGIELAKELRALPDYKYTPILMLTTESVASKKAQAKAAGVSGWVTKPFQPDKLISIVNKLL